MLYSELTTTQCSTDQKQFFQVTHRFHPLFKQEYEIVTIRQNWGEQRIYYYDKQGKLKSFPLSWTSAQPLDAFVTQANGRSPFRIEDLLTLRALLDKILAK